MAYSLTSITILFTFLSPILSQAKCPANTTLSLSQTTAIPQFSLPAAYSKAVAPQDPKIVGQILNTLSLYPLAIDGKNFDALSLVFTEDVTTNYSEQLNVLTPLSTVKVVLERSLRPVTSQHSYGTQIVELLEDCEARSASYFTATHFGMGKYVGQVYYAYGQYQDFWVKETTNDWKIKARTLVYMGPGIGNLSIFTPQ